MQFQSKSQGEKSEEAQKDTTELKQSPTANTDPFLAVKAPSSQT